MATRKGATKTDSRGRRFRYDGRRWVRIKATGNGNNTTSARNRSARQGRSNATVTNSDNRRSSQSSRSNRVTNAGQRTNTGNGRVTGLNAQQRRRLPVGQRGGDLARQGGERVSTGRRALPPASSTSLGRGTNQRISGTRTQGQGGNPRSTGARVTSSDNQSSRGSGSSTQQRGGQGGSRRTGGQRRLTGQGQRPQLPAGQTRSGGSNQFRANGRGTYGRGGNPALGAPATAAGKLLGGVGLAADFINTSRDLAASLQRGEGYAAIPGLLQRAMQPRPDAPTLPPVPPQEAAAAAARSSNERDPESGLPLNRPDKPQVEREIIGVDSESGLPIYGPKVTNSVPEGYTGMADMSGDAILPTAPLSAQQPSAPINGGNTPAPIPMAAPAASGGVRDTSVYDSMTADQKMAAWAELFPLLAAKVKPGQAGYSTINPSGPPAQQPNPAMTGEGAPGAQSPSVQTRPVQIGEEVPFVDPMSGAQLNISRQMTPEERRRMRRGYPASNNYFA